MNETLDHPLATFFRAVVSELRKRLTPEEFADMLKECGTEREEQDVGANATPTPGQTPNSGE